MSCHYTITTEQEFTVTGDDFVKTVNKDIQTHDEIDSIQNNDSLHVQSHQYKLSVTNENTKNETNITSSSSPNISHLKSKPMNFDIGIFDFINISSSEIEQAVRNGPEIVHENLPKDRYRKFPINIFSYTLPNGEVVDRDWLVWSRCKNALFCFPCRLFSKLVGDQRSYLASVTGYTSEGNQRWKKLYDRIPQHQNSIDHKKCYVEWKCMEKRIFDELLIEHQLFDQITTEAQKWREILKRILHVIIFIGERGLPLRGDNCLIGDANNGLFLGNFFFLIIDFFRY